VNHQKTVLDNMGLVRKIVNQRVRQYPGLQKLKADIMQAGAVGLCEAAKAFDPGRGWRFSTYAYPWIMNSISKLLCTYKLMPIKRLGYQEAHQRGSMAWAEEVEARFDASKIEAHLKRTVKPALRPRVVPVLWALASRIEPWEPAGKPALQYQGLSRSAFNAYVQSVGKVARKWAEGPGVQRG
jgi:RNA polymerase sigma factor (sigma-70 family)